VEIFVNNLDYLPVSVGGEQQNKWSHLYLYCALGGTHCDACTSRTIVQGNGVKQSYNTAMETQRGRGCIAPTHSRPRQYMEVSGQRHSPAVLYPRVRTPGTHCTGGWVGPRAGLDTEARGKILYLLIRCVSVVISYCTVLFKGNCFVL
jgi:hypothetical protein